METKKVSIYDNTFINLIIFIMNVLMTKASYQVSLKALTIAKGKGIFFIPKSFYHTETKYFYEVNLPDWFYTKHQDTIEQIKKEALEMQTRLETI